MRPLQEAQGGYLQEVLECPYETDFFLVQDGSVELVNAEPHWLTELGNLRHHSSGGSLRSWGARYVDKLLSGRNWRLGFTVGVNQGRQGEEPPGSFRLPEGSQSATRCGLVRSWSLLQQLEKYAVKPLPGRNWEMMSVFACSSVLSPGV